MAYTRKMRWLMINGYTGQNKVQSVDPARSCNWIIKRDSPAEVGRIVDEDTRRGVRRRLQVSSEDGPKALVHG